MIFKLAWRNVWRNKTRSGVLLLAITFGLWGGISTMGLMEGMNEDRIKNFLKTEVSHIQIHHPDFIQDQDVNKGLEKSNQYLEQIRQHPKVHGVAPRIVVNGMVSSPTNSTGIQLKGIHPDQEKTVTNIHEHIKEGNYFDRDMRNPVLLGKKQADQLGVELGSKVVINFQNPEGDIASGAFTIVGLYQTSNAQFDKNNAFIPINTAQELLDSPNLVHEMAIFLEDREQARPVADQLAKSLPENYLVQTWREVEPSLAYLNDFSTQMLYFIMVIILLALAFGIVNTMLMAVMERTRELGMLMAVGLDKSRVFSMVILETIFLAIQGGILGLGIGWWTIHYFGKHGISLASFSEGLSSFGYADRVYLMLDWFHYPLIAGLVILTAILSAIYPAIKALKLNPAEAISNIQ